MGPIKPYRSKRVLDIIAASIGLLIVSVPAAIIALLIRFRVRVLLCSGR